MVVDVGGLNGEQEEEVQEGVRQPRMVWTPAQTAFLENMRQAWQEIPPKSFEERKRFREDVADELLRKWSFPNAGHLCAVSGCLQPFWIQDSLLRWQAVCHWYKNHGRGTSPKVDEPHCVKSIFGRQTHSLGASELWGRENRDIITAATKSGGSAGHGGNRNAVRALLFEGLPNREKLRWAEKAQQAKDEAEHGDIWQAITT